MRGKRAKKRKLELDPRYKSELVTRFVNKVMVHGRKEFAQKTFYNVIERGGKENKVTPLEFVNQVVENVSPALELKARRVGGANYNVPVPVTPVRQETLVVRWVVDAARAKGGAKFETLLFNEMNDAYNGAGDAIKKKADVERMAEANKAFAHFRW